VCWSAMVKFLKSQRNRYVDRKGSIACVAVCVAECCSILECTGIFWRNSAGEEMLIGEVI